MGSIRAPAGCAGAWSRIAVGIVVGATGPRAIGRWPRPGTPTGAILPWVFERLLGFLAYLAMTGSVVYGLLLSTKILDAIAHRPITFALHQDLACIGLGLAGGPRDAARPRPTVPFTLAQIAVPGLAPYAPLWVGVGQVAFYLMALVVGSFYVRRQIGQRAWRTLHYVTFLAFVGATGHGIIAGTDTGTPWAWWIYVGRSIVVVFLLVYRIAQSSRWSAAAGRSAPVSGPSSELPAERRADRVRPSWRRFPRARPASGRSRPGCSRRAR